MGTPIYGGTTYGGAKKIEKTNNSYNVISSDIHTYQTFNNMNYDDEKDFNSILQSEEIGVEKTEEKSEYLDAYNKAVSNLGGNTLFYLGTGVSTYLTDAFITNIEDKAIKSGVSICRDVVFSGIFKSSSSSDSIKGLFKGAGKKTMTILEKNTLPKLTIENLKKMPGSFKNNIKDAIKKSSEVYKNIKGSNAESSKKLLEILKKGADVKDISMKDRIKTSFKDLIKKNKDYKFFDSKYTQYTKSGFAEFDFDNFQVDFLDKTFSVSGLSTTYGVDLVATFGIEVFSDVIFEDMSFLDAVKQEVVEEGGANLLGSVWKTTGQIAFQTIGTAVGGPAFGKVCGAAGSIVGKFAGDYTASLLDNDSKACAVTAATVVGGSVAGSAIGTAIVAAGVCATVPVAGWVIGGCILAGAVVGSAIGVIGHKFKWW